ncbi:MAG: alpha/beta hydrolase [Rhodospirillaceae bacterium]|nr:alpha/beta hydrolase [Rhodospirillaceae bacterium]
MAKVTKHYADGRFGQIHHRRAAPVGVSTQPPLLLFHMSPYSSVIYQNFLAAMGEQRLTIAVDTPGFGNSDAPPSPPQIQDYAAAVGDMMDALKLRHVDVMGYHTGSKIALEVAIQRPAQVRKVVMISAAIWTDEELKDHRAQFAKTEISEDGAHLVKWWKAAMHWSMTGRTKEQVAEVFPARMMNPAISWWGHAAAFDYKTADALQKVSQPVLILNPQDDIWEFTPRAKKYLRNGRIHDLPGWSHGFLDVKTQEATTIVGGFLDEK